VSGSGISWTICKSAPRSRQITTPAPHHSVFYRPDALPATQPTASKHWRHWAQHRFIIGSVVRLTLVSCSDMISCYILYILTDEHFSGTLPSMHTCIYVEFLMCNISTLSCWSGLSCRVLLRYCVFCFGPCCIFTIFCRYSLCFLHIAKLINVYLLIIGCFDCLTMGQYNHRIWYETGVPVMLFIC